jgi:excisionase family DNA binding protein
MNKNHEPDFEPLLVRPMTAMKMLGVSHSTYYRLVDNGEIKTARLGGRNMAVYASLLAIVKKAGAAKEAA